jgi:hypothetical protein
MLTRSRPITDNCRDRKGQTVPGDRCEKFCGQSGRAPASARQSERARPACAPPVDRGEIEIAGRRISLWKSPRHQIGQCRIKLGECLAKAAGGNLWRNVARFDAKAHGIYPETPLSAVIGRMLAMTFPSHGRPRDKKTMRIC